MNRILAGTVVLAIATTGASASAWAGSRHHHLTVREGRSVAVAGVSYDRHWQRGGSALVSDGPGTGFGFHRLPGPYRFGAAVARDRQVGAVRDAVTNSAIDNADFRHGYPGSSVYQYGSNASYGVFTGGDGYGTPFFAGYYGKGDGADYGPFGTAYAN